MYRKDWIMDQIESFIETIHKVFLHEDNLTHDIAQTENTTQDSLYQKLDLLIHERKINEAENLLFDHLEPKDEKELAGAVDFYSKLNQLNDETLESANYSREEIEQGLKDIMNEFGIKIELI